MNFASIVVLSIVLICIFFALKRIIKNKNGECGCGCSGCSSKNMCHKKRNN